MPLLFSFEKYFLKSLLYRKQNLLKPQFAPNFEHLKKIKQSSSVLLYKNYRSILFSPRVFLRPRLRIICYYIAH